MHACPWALGQLDTSLEGCKESLTKSERETVRTAPLSRFSTAGQADTRTTRQSSATQLLVWNLSQT